MDAEEAVHTLFTAVRRGHVEEVARLLDADPHLMEARDEEEEGNNRTPLMWAAEQGHVGVLRLLLEWGADVNASDDIDFTALHYAAVEGHEEVVSILLSRGADSSRRSVDGFTALIIASEGGHLGLVRQLLQHMAARGLDERDGYGYTALWWACIKGHVEVARSLLLAGADHTIAGNNELTPRQAAAAYGRHACVPLLEWREGELERGYVLHRARCLSEPSPVSVPTYLTARIGPPPTVQATSLTEGSEGSMGKGKREAEEDEEDRDGEEEKAATLKYVLHDLARELYTELLEGFHK